MNTEPCPNCLSAMTGGAPNADLSKCIVCKGTGSVPKDLDPNSAIGRARPEYTRLLTDAEYRALRNRNWENVDKHTKDSQGNLLVYGCKYVYQRGEQTWSLAIPCGLDVRGNPGIAFCWVENSAKTVYRYECLFSESLTPMKDE